MRGGAECEGWAQARTRGDWYLKLGGECKVGPWEPGGPNANKAGFPGLGRAGVGAGGRGRWVWGVRVQDWSSLGLLKAGACLAAGYMGRQQGS